MTADEFGYTAETQTVDNDGVPTADFALSPEVAVDPVVGQPVFTEFTSNFTIVADVRNLEEYTVELVNATGVSEADLTVSVAGNAATFGQPLALGGVSADDVPVTVEVDGNFDEGDEFSLEHTFGGPGDDVVVTTGPTTLTETIGPPAFELSNFTAPEGQALGQAEPYAAAVTVTNTGQQAGTATAEWFLGPLGVAGSNPTANLAPGESQRVSLNFGQIDIGAFFGGDPVGLVHGFEATPDNPNATGDVTVDTFDVGSGSIPIFDPFGASRVGETATVYGTTVEFEDQNYDGPTSEVVVNTTNVVPNDDYVVVIHKTDNNGAPGQIIGNSGDLTGQQNNVTVTLDQELNETGEYAAMLHFASSDGPFGAPITRYTAGSVIPVFDTANVQTTSANFSVSGLSPQSATVNETEQFDVSATVENVGDTQGTQSVELRLEPDGAAVASQSVQLGVGNSTTVSFENVSVGTPGAYNHTVASEDDQATGDLTVLSLANFEVSNLSAPAEAAENESITVNATVTNTGDQAGTQDVLFQLDGDGNFDSPAVSVVAAENLTLAGGASQEVQLTVNAPDTVGVFEHGLFTADDNQTATLTVGNPQVVASLSDESGAVGENVTVEFNISSFDNTQRNVGAYDLNMTFDPSVVEFVNVSNELPPTLVVNDQNVDQGELKLTYFRGDGGSTPTPLTAVTIEFNITASGDSALQITESDSDVSNENGTSLNTIFEGGNVGSTQAASTTAYRQIASPVA